jgi:hypothetical protein
MYLIYFIESIIINYYLIYLNKFNFFYDGFILLSVLN